MAEVLNPSTPRGRTFDRTAPIMGDGGHMGKRGLATVVLC
jgi:hypothetical protein